MGTKKTKKVKLVDNNFGDLLVQSAQEAVDFSRGSLKLKEKIVTLLREPPSYDKNKIKKIREERLEVSQEVFARIFGESVSAIRNWEQGTRNMSKPARRILQILEKDPEEVIKMMA